MQNIYYKIIYKPKNASPTHEPATFFRFDTLEEAKYYFKEMELNKTDWHLIKITTKEEEIIV